jgi:Flp pilus assembly protein TadG
MNTNMRTPQQGAAGVEFAILLIPLLAILTGVTEFGRMMYSYNMVTKAARDAARLMSTQGPGDPDYAALNEMAKCTAVFGNTTCTGNPLVPGLTTAMVTICDPVSCAGTHFQQATGSGVINLVTVTIGSDADPVPFSSVAQFAPQLFGVASINLAPIAVTMRQIL